MIQIVRFHSRKFHLTSNTLLRRIIHRNSGGSEEHENKLSVDVSPVIQTPESNYDYLGIESDEGAITVRPQKHSLPQDIKTSGRIKERFYRASYGVVRYDAENKPKFHGQYGNQMDFAFPYYSSENADVRSIINSSCDGHVLKKVESFNDAESNFIHSNPEEDKSKLVSTNEGNEDLNYVDECYFGGTKIGNLSEDNRSEELTSDELNFVDEYYFGRENSAELSSTTKQDVLKNAINPKNFSSDEKYDLSSSKHNTTSEFDSNHIAEKLTLDTMDFIDSSYFRNVNASNHLAVEEQALLENSSSEHVFDKRNPQEPVSWCSTNNVSRIDYNESLNKDLNYSSNLNSDDSLKHNSVHSRLAESTMEKQVISDNNVQNSERSVTESDYPVPIKVHEFERLGEFNQKVTEHSSQSNLTKPRSLSNVLKEKLNLKKSMPQAKLESSSESKRLISQKNAFKYSTSVESEQIEQIPTAHDFVQKLRKRQEVPEQSHQKAVTETSTEKFDSKGFRILKNQVKSLSQFTRSEVIDILKKNIIYSDDDLIVLNKPYSLVMHESETTKEPCLSMFLNDLAKEMDPGATDPNLFTVHRLDKETTGCLLLARNETMAQTLKSLFARRKIVKKYWIITISVPDPAKGIIDIPISEGSVNNRKRMVLHPKLPKDMPYKSHSRNGRPAITSYEVISESGNAALVEVTPMTGVKHQIRVHFGFGLGCPILGDHKYSYLDKLVPQKLPADMLQKLQVRQSKVRYIPMHIHAKSVMIPNYFEGGRDLFVNIPLPDHMKENMKRLKFRK